MAGMTLIELMATVAIIGLLVAFGVPSLRIQDEHQSLEIAERQLESAVYQMRSLALAPAGQSMVVGASSQYDVLGYGVYVYQGSDPRAGSGLVCSDTHSLPGGDDRYYAVVIESIRLRATGFITVVPAYADLTKPVPTCDAGTGQQYITKFDQGVHVHIDKPWFITEPVHTVDGRYADLFASLNGGDATPSMINPSRLTLSDGSSQVVVELTQSTDTTLPVGVNYLITAGLLESARTAGVGYA